MEAGERRSSVRWRHHLPHWERGLAWHAITIHCQGSLPAKALEHLKAVQAGLKAVAPRSEAAYRERKKRFVMVEKYLDQSEGFTPFTQPDVVARCWPAWKALEIDGWQVGLGVFMPNHVHALIRRQREPTGMDLKTAIKRFKGRTARWGNQAIERVGRFWMEDWYDRWMRSDSEFRHTFGYIQNNPVKAGLVAEPADYPWFYQSPEASLPTMESP
ncbi:MAG: transposase [Opitutales bacterium]